MKLHTLAVLASVFIAACGSKPLTETECRALANKEIDFAVSKVPAEDAESFKAFLASKADDGNAQCMAGKTYSRSDYKCMIKAVDANEIGECIKRVNKRLGHG
jgi:small lipoprotein (TIGR04454 family)